MKELYKNNRLLVKDLNRFECDRLLFWKGLSVVERDTEMSLDKRATCRKGAPDKRAARRSVATAEQEAYLCAKEPVMRRSAAALLAHPPPLPAPPPPEGLEAVRAAATKALRAVDEKLAAVRAAVSGDRVAQLPGQEPVSAVQGSAGLRRSGSDPELRRHQPTSETSKDGAYEAGADALLSLDGRGTRERWLQAQRSSCPSFVQAHGGASAGAAGSAAPADSAELQAVSRGHGGCAAEHGDGGRGGAPAAEAASEQGPWQGWPLPPDPPPAALCASWSCESGQLISVSAAPIAPAASSGADDQGPRSRRRRPLVASASCWPQQLPGVGVGDDHDCDGRAGPGAMNRRPGPPDAPAADGELGRLSPRRPGPMLTGRAGW